MADSLSLPNCGCSESSQGDRVFTCPICCRAALRFFEGERVDQAELFAYVDKQSSVSALHRDRDGFVPIADVLRSIELPLDDLPF